jgi:hypothetical protein
MKDYSFRRGVSWDWTLPTPGDEIQVYESLVDELNLYKERGKPLEVYTTLCYVAVTTKSFRMFMLDRKTILAESSFNNIRFVKPYREAKERGDLVEDRIWDQKMSESGVIISFYEPVRLLRKYVYLCWLPPVSLGPFSSIRDYIKRKRFREHIEFVEQMYNQDRSLYERSRSI